jgi:LacI family transcriptional regulator
VVTQARATIRDVAARCGVSVATVSKVINGRYGVAPSTDAIVRSAISELSYEASLSAQSLRSRRTNVIGILVADIEPFSVEVLQGASQALRGTGFELVVYSASSGFRVGWERRYLSRLSGTVLDGALLVTPTVIDVDYGAPIVAVDPHAGQSTVPTVVSDNLAGAEQAVRHLIDLGHRRVAMLKGRPDLESARLRELGYRLAMAAAGVTVDEDLVQLGDYNPAVAVGPVRRLLTSADRPTAIFAASDTCALAAIDVATELGLRVPDDVSVVGFDNIPDSALSNPPLTTVDQSIRSMGRQAAEMLVRLVRGEKIADNLAVLPTRLVVRQSTRAV